MSRQRSGNFTRSYKLHATSRARITAGEALKQAIKSRGGGPTGLVEEDEMGWRPAWVGRGIQQGMEPIWVGRDISSPE
jgi:hypothetical protein